MYELVLLYKDISNDLKINSSKVIALQETWCSNDFDNSNLNLSGYTLHPINQGNGKGIAFYYRKDFQVKAEVNEEEFQMAKISGNGLDVINIYRSSGTNTPYFLEKLNDLIRAPRRVSLLVI